MPIDQQSLKAMAPGSVVVDAACGPLAGNVSNARPGATLVTGE